MNLPLFQYRDLWLIYDSRLCFRVRASPLVPRVHSHRYKDTSSSTVILQAGGRATARGTAPLPALVSWCGCARVCVRLPWQKSDGKGRYWTMVKLTSLQGSLAGQSNYATPCVSFLINKLCQFTKRASTPKAMCCQTINEKSSQ